MPPLDGMRGIAVLAVMAFHFSLFSHISVTTAAASAWEGIASVGWIGVDLFFVLSGFLITGILYDSKNSAGYFRTFYARRSLRIFPLYYGVLAAFFFVLPLVFPTSAAVRHHTADELWYWTHLSNVEIALHGWGEISLYVGHFWSLAVEEQFYLVWPIVVLLLSGRQLLRFCAGVMVFSLALRTYLFATGEGVAAFVLTPARMDTLAFGAVLAVVMRDAELYARLRRFVRPLAVLSAILLAGLLLWRNGLDKNDAVAGTIGFTLLGALFSTAIFFALTAARAGHYNRLLSSRGLRFFGKYSYALYVFHQPVALVLTALGLPAILGQLGVSGFGAQLAYGSVATMMSLILSLISWNLLEKQFLKLKDRFAARAEERPAVERLPTIHFPTQLTKDSVMKLPRTIKIAAAFGLIIGVVGGGSFLLGAVAQRSCWPRFCTHAWNTPVDSVIETTHARIETESVNLPFVHHYGALEVLDSSYVVASGTGELFHITDHREIKQLPFSIPLDDKEFHRDNGTDGIQANSFSVKDILVRPGSGQDVEILATYHVWFPERKCFTLRMSSAIANPELTQLRRDWQTVFDSEPCSAVKESGVRFAGTGAGGRMSAVSPAEVLLTVGDHEYDATKGTMAQDPGSSFGKTILVNTSTGQARTFSAGHRNPQGLITARDGRIWSTEHGPKGGDELNLVQEGQNYGWPFSTYGTQYNGSAWPLEPSPNQHSTFVRPTYSWVPSIGVSQLIEIEGKKFESWSGDLLVSSLRGSSLFRLRVDGERVAFAEQIQLGGARIRDLVEHPDGTIALLSYGRMILMRPASETNPAPATATVAPRSSITTFLDTTRTLVKDLVGKRTL
jgi:peptidoglycan/LPS O-acetylase OafA/YrhL